MVAVGSCMAVAAWCVLIVSAALPVLLSEAAGGWTIAARSSFSTAAIPSMKGKRILVTGANTGIGRVTALELARAGAVVVVHGRTRERVAAVVSDIAAAGGSSQVVTADFSSLKSVAHMASELAALGPLDVAILNAGLCKECIGKTDAGFEMTGDGFELHIQVNHLAHQLLVELLLQSSTLTSTSRIVSVSSGLHARSYPEGILYESWQAKGNYTDGFAYGQSKLANVMMAHEVHTRFGLASVSLHPGIIASDLGRYVEPSGIVQILFSTLYSFACMTVEQGALTQLWAATVPDLQEGYFVPVGRREAPSHPAFSADNSAECWDRTHKILAPFLESVA